VHRSVVAWSDNVHTKFCESRTVFFSEVSMRATHAHMHTHTQSGSSLKPTFCSCEARKICECGLNFTDGITLSKLKVGAQLKKHRHGDPNTFYSRGRFSILNAVFSDNDAATIL
jgi:hypothetical protein